MRTQSSRSHLLRRVVPLARRALFGTLSETYRTCGQPGCRCHQGHKHGPHLYVSFRGAAGTTRGYYVPQEFAEPMRKGIAAWQELQRVLQELAEANRKQLWARRSDSGRRSRHGAPSARAAKRVRNDVARGGQTLG
jgi:hypothetical protein